MIRSSQLRLPSVATFAATQSLRIRHQQLEFDARLQLLGRELKPPSDSSEPGAVN